MASSIVFGTIGSGKTYYLVYYVMKHYKEYDHVVSNFPIKIPGKPVLQWSPKYITSGLNKTLYVLDEAWALWNSRDFDDFDHDVHEWFALSRHYNNHIMLASQAVGRIDKVIRELSQDFIFVHSWKMFWLKQPRPIFINVEHYDRIVEDSPTTGINQPSSEPFKREWVLFRKKIAVAYDTKLQPTAPKSDFILTEPWGSNVFR